MRWRLALLGLALVAALTPLSPDIVESVYSTGVYPPLQAALTSLSNRIPIALFDVFIGLVVIAWMALLGRDIARCAWVQVASRLALRTATLAAALYLLFLATWGLNYRRVPLEDKLEFDYRAVTPQAAVDLAQTAVLELNRLFAPRQTSHVMPAGDVDPALARAFADAQRQLGMTLLAVPGRPKPTLLDRYFSAASIDGMTDPYFLETMTLGGLLPVERPMIVAHEWAHLAGYADEGEANFIGWLVCLNGNPFARYSAWLFLYAETMHGLEPPARAAVSAHLDQGPKQDLAAISQRIRRHVKPAISAIGWGVYDQYLKANGIERGTRSYTDVVRLVLGTRLGATAVPALTLRKPLVRAAEPATSRTP